MAESDSDGEEMPKQRGRPRNAVNKKRKRHMGDTPSPPNDDLEELEERPAPVCAKFVTLKSLVLTSALRNVARPVEGVTNRPS